MFGIVAAEHPIVDFAIANCLCSLLLTMCLTISNFFNALTFFFFNTTTAYVMVYANVFLAVSSVLSTKLSKALMLILGYEIYFIVWTRVLHWAYSRIRLNFQ